MSEQVNLRALSRLQFMSSNRLLEDINCGSLQRIADAMELMAKNHSALLNELKWANEKIARVELHAKRLKGTNAALRAHLTRLRKKSTHSAVQ